MQWPKNRDSWLAQRQGDWSPGMPSLIFFIIFGLFTVQGANRGVDYITGDRPDVTQSLTVVEEAMPLQVWGVLFLMASLVVAVGMVFRRHNIIIAGCLYFVVLYSGITWGLTMKMLTRMTPMSEFWAALTDPDIHAPTPFMWVVIILMCVGCAALTVVVKKHRLLVGAVSALIILLTCMFATYGHLATFIYHSAQTFPLDGWRTPSSFALTTTIWALFAWGTKVMQKARRGQ
ncbi:hypothetical protein [Corynebacterium aurimucosum]|uniref:Putative membrane protein n=1 Tax=Corynebacterium aurimucosum (strain ATCC 700975 / DSM 44827 / CIP 107346 / CN-1) TaxID=548476 RepID=C3PI47_CORA7|nr:hypothetical protein [Corynebacterium aurimucosum]ACP33501.1 putative membrane protein [Corynebacterium aurimucosum ATCC 700975]QQU92388.1 hypothetical protein I6I67_09085 [Corynebacterium aurimucosum]